MLTKLHCTPRQIPNVLNHKSVAPQPLTQAVTQLTVLPQTKRCSKCKEHLPLSSFNKARTKRDGHQTICRECYKEIRRGRNFPVSVERKKCTSCKQTLPASDFYKSSQAKDGLCNECKKCHSIRAANNNFPVSVSEKRCVQCEEVKSATEFNKNKRSTDGLQVYCKACFHQNRKERWDPNNQLRADLKIYGQTLEGYLKLLDEQGGVCAQCGKPETREGKRLAQDHCHETGQLRGLLCHRCNTGFGSYLESIENLERAILYKQKWDREMMDAETA